MNSGRIEIFKYFAFVLASAIIIIGFVTSKSYLQLAFSALLYPILVYLGLQLFPRKEPLRKQTVRKQEDFKVEKTEEEEILPTSIIDIDRRAFLKMLGLTGVSFFLFSIFGRRLEGLFFGKQSPAIVNEDANSASNQFGPVTEGYKITEIDEGDSFGYFGFVNKDGGWMIMRENSEDGAFRYASGDHDFPGNWSNRSNLNYGYYHTMFKK